MQRCSPAVRLIKIKNTTMMMRIVVKASTRTAKTVKIRRFSTVALITKTRMMLIAMKIARTRMLVRDLEIKTGSQVAVVPKTMMMITMMMMIAMKTTRTAETAEMLNGQPGCCHKEERLPDVRGGGGGDIHNDGYVDDNGYDDGGGDLDHGDGVVIVNFT